MRIGELLDFTAYLRSHHGMVPSIGLILLPDDALPMGLLRSIARSLDVSICSYDTVRDSELSKQLLDTVRYGRGVALLVRDAPQESLTKALRYLNQPFPERYPAPVIILIPEELYRSIEHWHPLKKINPTMRATPLRMRPTSVQSSKLTGEQP